MKKMKEKGEGREMDDWKDTEWGRDRKAEKLQMKQNEYGKRGL